MPVKKHIRPEWANGNVGRIIKEQVKVPINIGFYNDDVLCCVQEDLEGIGVILGKTWQYDKHCTYSARPNTYTVLHRGVTLLLNAENAHSMAMVNEEREYQELLKRQRSRKRNRSSQNCMKQVGPSEYLAITGLNIDDIRLAKKAWIWPLQQCTRFDISPVNYTFEVQAMSAEKLPFILPAVFTIGSRVTDEASLILYARLISQHGKHSNHVVELVKGVIEGETRVLAASMTMEAIFKGTKEFKQEVFEKVQLELNQFGLFLYNANVKQLVDVQGHEYVSYLGQKTQMEAANQAKIDVSEARMKVEIGAKLRKGQTTQNAAKIDVETKIASTQRQGDGKKEEIKVNTDVKIYQNQKEAEVAKANAELATKKTGWAQASQLAEVEAAKAVAIRDAELQCDAERKNALSQTEKLKSQHLSKAVVEYETKVQEANWGLYKKQKEAEAEIAREEAAFYARQQAGSCMQRRKNQKQKLRKGRLLKDASADSD